jgi:hypothetical protein
MPLPPDFADECLYGPDAWFLHDVRHLDRDRVEGIVDTTRLGPLVDAQVPRRGHPRHVPGAVMVQLTGTLGNLHAVYALGLRVSEGWVGFGTHVRGVRFPSLGRIGPELMATACVTRVRVLRGRHFVDYAFRYEQEGRLVYESEQTAVWVRGEHAEETLGRA